MAELITLKCGHVCKIPANQFGRGKARVKRLEAISAKLCADCAVDALRSFASKLTLIDGTPYTKSQACNYVAKREVKARSETLERLPS